MAATTPTPTAMLLRAAAIRWAAVAAYSTAATRSETGLYGFDVLRSDTQR